MLSFVFGALLLGSLERQRDFRCVSLAVVLLVFGWASLWPGNLCHGFCNSLRTSFARASQSLESLKSLPGKLFSRLSWVMSIALLLHVGLSLT